LLDVEHDVFVKFNIPVGKFVEREYYFAPKEATVQAPLLPSELFLEKVQPVDQLIKLKNGVSDSEMLQLLDNTEFQLVCTDDSSLFV